jgi:ferritin-like protein
LVAGLSCFPNTAYNLCTYYYYYVQIRKTHAEEKNEILKTNKMLEISIEDFKDNVHSLEERVYSLEKKVSLPLFFY